VCSPRNARKLILHPSTFGLVEDGRCFRRRPSWIGRPKALTKEKSAVSALFFWDSTPFREVEMAWAGMTRAGLSCRVAGGRAAALGRI
jgi:hypothetical protein